MKLQRVIKCIASFVLIVLFGQVCAAFQGDTLLKQKVTTILDNKLELIQGKKLSTANILPTFYQKSDFQPVWTSHKTILSFLEAVKESEEDGLDPENYHYSVINRLINQVDLNDTESPDRIDLDLVLTDSLIKLGYHLFTGKVNPAELDSGWNYQRDINEQSAINYFHSIIKIEPIKDEINYLKPSHAVYKSTKKNLALYRQIAANGGWPYISKGEKLEKGNTGPRVVELRMRLVVEDSQLTDTTSPIFDEALEKAVLKAQRRYFLDTDGVVGKETLAALNKPVQQRIDQIRVNLERMRWVMHALKGHFLLIDIAGYEAAYFENGNVLWNSRVQVGRSFRKTPIFRDHIRYLEFNPTWTVPPTIFKKDVWPELKDNPGYLQEKNMILIDHQGNTVDASSVDFSQYTARNFPYQVRQQPGPSNALGLVKFMFPNSYHVYLHDTPSKTLFDKNKRTFSSGCIRIERPFELVDILLNNNTPRGFTGYNEILESNKTTRVSLKNPVPILLMYWTSRVDADGSIRFKDDIYGLDEGVLASLNEKWDRINQDAHNL